MDFKEFWPLIFIVLTVAVWIAINVAAVRGVLWG